MIAGGIRGGLLSSLAKLIVNPWPSVRSDRNHRLAGNGFESTGIGVRGKGTPCPRSAMEKPDRIVLLPAKTLGVAYVLNVLQSKCSRRPAATSLAKPASPDG